jgi:hypothetical protein
VGEGKEAGEEGGGVMNSTGESRPEKSSPLAMDLATALLSRSAVPKKATLNPRSWSVELNTPVF